MIRSISVNPNLPQVPKSYSPGVIDILGMLSIAGVATAIAWHRRAKQKDIERLKEIVVEVDKIWQGRTEGVSLGEPLWLQDGRHLTYLNYLKILEIIDEPEIARKTSWLWLVITVSTWNEAIAKYHRYYHFIEDLVYQGDSKAENLWQEIISFPYLLGDGNFDYGRATLFVELRQQKDRLIGRIEDTKENWSRGDIATAIVSYKWALSSFNEISELLKSNNLLNQELSTKILHVSSLLGGKSKDDFFTVAKERYDRLDFDYMKELDTKIEQIKTERAFNSVTSIS